MKTILIGIPCLKVGGTEVQTLRLVEALTENGYHCVIVCYFEYDITMTRRFEEAGNRVVCLSAYGRRPERIRDVYRFLKTGLKRVVREYQPDIAHIQYMAPGAMPIWILRRLGVKTILATLHTDADVYKDLRLVHFLQRHVTRLFTCVSEKADQNFFGSVNSIENCTQFKKHDHITLPNCLASNYPMGTVKRYEGGPFTIGIVARLEKIKGVDLVLPAFAKVLQQSPDSHLIIVGDGSLLELMQRQQQELHIPAEKVEWLSGVHYKQLPALYKRMDLVWMPSRSEGFGLSALEAMAQGCPIIVSAVGGLTEIIHDGLDGIYCKPEDADDIANKTLNLITDPDRMAALSENGLKRASRFSFDCYSQSVKKIYQLLQ